MSIAIRLSPSPGFCIKSSTLQDGVVHIRNEPLRVPKGLKIFVNIAWDQNVPPPPEASKEDIQRAMQGQDIDERVEWFVPVVVSEGRNATDKAGKPALVFDCVYNMSLKTWSLADPDFKIYLIELALQRVEAQTSLMLSRQIGTPNISSKGKLKPRTVHVPETLFEHLDMSVPLPADASSVSASSPAPNKPLIEDITLEEKKKKKKKEPSPSFDGKLKGILKTGSAPKPIVQGSVLSGSDSPLIWRWCKDEEERLRITIAVPNLVHPRQTRDLIHSTALDVEARRLILNIPDRPILDIDLSLSDAEMVAMHSTHHARAGVAKRATVSAADIQKSLHSASGDQSQIRDADLELNNTLMLKRQREFDVDGTRAEWRVADGVLIVFA
ncbi:hypothetical protein APHAL10511_000864 [Amanita phalloides]|nr:hypothetical protein APHAL10511_000864 [Amanita phalloides]